MNVDITRLRVLRQVRASVPVREHFECAYCIAEKLVLSEDNKLSLTETGLRELASLEKEYPEIPDAYLRSAEGTVDSEGMKVTTKDLRSVVQDIAELRMAAKSDLNTPDEKAEARMGLAYTIEELEGMLDQIKKEEL